MRAARIALVLLLASAVYSSACDLPNGYEMYEDAGLTAPAELKAYQMIAECSTAELEELEAEYDQEQGEPMEETPQIELIGYFKAYAYCPCCTCTQGLGLTAMGTTPQEGRTIAVDPTVIPLGTPIAVEYADGSIIDGVAEDTGGATIRGNSIDVYIASHERAKTHGVKEVKIYKEEER